MPWKYDHTNRVGKLTLGQKIDRRSKVNVTARAKCGRRLKSVKELVELAILKRSVYCANCWGLLPAIVVANMTAHTVQSAIDGHGIFVYEK